jgi:plastocyanin
VKLRSVAAPALALAVTLAAGGCGEKRETSTGGASGASPATPGTVSVSESEFKLTPASAQAQGSGPVTIRVKNDGATQHALVVVGPKGAVKTPTLAPGQGATLKADLKPGTYAMFCPIDGHKRKGMVGKIVVGKGGGSGSGGGTSTDKGGDGGGGGGSGGSRGGGY